ncbi:MAG: hypothetical protein RIS47_2202 [Bacteroidota bacterium]
MGLRENIKALGPGLMWAGAAIGVSHLVQSTRAGADYGFQLVWIVLLANLFKYPFFEFGPRYAAATGNNLLVGYHKLGKWAIPLYLVITWLTMFSIQAAVTVVTASLFTSIFGLFSTKVWTYILLVVGGFVVWIGNYKVLDRLIKLIIIVLTISTLTAVFFAFKNDINNIGIVGKQFNWADFADISFLIALVGWMPSAIDVSVWHSVWSVAQRETMDDKPTVKQALFDFNVGYLGTAFLALGFIALGALVMYGGESSFSNQAGQFSDQVISLFTKSLGSWSFPIIAMAALTTMVSTTITVLDAVPRVLTEAFVQVRPNWDNCQTKRKLTTFWLLVLVLGSSLIVMFLLGNLKIFVDIATILSFLTAPILGWMNLRVITSADFPVEHVPPLWLKVLSYIGLCMLIVFSVYYLVQQVIH